MLEGTQTTDNFTASYHQLIDKSEQMPNRSHFAYLATELCEKKFI